MTVVILQRLILHARPEVFRLYWRSDQPGSAMEMGPGSTLDLDTYFNSFDETLWRRFTHIGALRLQLDMQGEATVLVWRHTREGDRVLVAEAREEGSGMLELDIPCPAHVRAAGRLAIEIVSSAGPAKLLGGRWVTEGNPVDIRLLPVICTHNRDAPLKRLIERLASDRAALDAVDGIVVINNGDAGLLRRLGWTPMPAALQGKLRVVEQDNVGGAGGFTRGILEARDTGATHVILMDDDVEIEPEAIYRTARLYALAVEDMVIGGQMLDLFRPNILYEAGARLNLSRLSLEPLHHELDLAEPGVLSNFADASPMHYNGWWFMGLPLRLIGRHGLPMPCFIRGDDVEFGLRLHEAGVPIVSTPGIGIWHEPFYAKLGSWHLYYEFRNMLVLVTRHRQDPAPALIWTTLRWIIADLLTFRYQRAALLLRAVKDFIDGPEIFFRNPQDVHRSLDAIRTCFPPLRTARFQVLEQPDPPEGPRSRFSLFLGVAAALLTEWHRRDGNRAIRIHPRDHLWFRVRGADLVAVDEGWEQDLPTYRRSRATFRALAQQSFHLWLRMRREMRPVVTRWKEAHPIFTGEHFWRRYLAMAPTRATGEAEALPRDRPRDAGAELLAAPDDIALRR